MSTHVYMSMNIYIYINAYIYISTHRHVYTYLHISYTCLHRIGLYMPMCIYIYIYIRINVHMYDICACILYVYIWVQRYVRRRFQTQHNCWNPKHNASFSIPSPKICGHSTRCTVIMCLCTKSTGLSSSGIWASQRRKVHPAFWTRTAMLAAIFCTAKVGVFLVAQNLMTSRKQISCETMEAWIWGWIELSFLLYEYEVVRKVLAKALFDTALCVFGSRQGHYTAWMVHPSWKKLETDIQLKLEVGTAKHAMSRDHCNMESYAFIKLNSLQTQKQLLLYRALSAKKYCWSLHYGPNKISIAIPTSTTVSTVTFRFKKDKAFCRSQMPRGVVFASQHPVCK